MKKTRIITLVLGALSFSLALTSQTTVNVITGIHSSRVQADGVSTDFLNIQPLNRITAGVLVDQPLDKYLSVRSGVIYKQKGFNISEGTDITIGGMGFPVGVKVATELNTINIPLMLKYDFKNTTGITPYIAAGTGLSYASSGTVRTKATAILDFTLSNTPLDLSSDVYNRWGIDGNITAGATIPYGKGHFLGEVAYSHGLTNFTSEDFIVDAGIITKGVSFNIGYGIKF